MQKDPHFNLIETTLPAEQILRSSLLNKGTAFTLDERNELGLHGFLPEHVSTIEEQVKRRYLNFSEKKLEIAKYLFLMGIQDRNEVLFYRVALEYAEEVLPYIYTPTVGDISLNYSNLYVENRGAYISYSLKSRMQEMINNIPKDDVEVIVVTDGSRILGLGDVGIGGMTIPVGKLSLYTLFGGIHPSKTLPILLDVGTDNQRLLNDPLYLGSRHPRITGAEYDNFVDLFVKAIKQRFPKVLLQWEDFSKPHATELLYRYQDQICSFNDDIQGTASVALAALLSAVKAKKESLKDQRFLIFGGGGAGMGIAKMIYLYLTSHGLSQEEAKSLFYIIDRFGLIHDKQSSIDFEQKQYARKSEEVASWKVEHPESISLEDVVDHAKPTVLIGVSAQPGVFGERAVRKMNTYCRPIIFPLSNPTSHSEANPHDLLEWTDGRALIATGSPPMVIDYKGKKHSITQCNNVYIFPGIGLGIIATHASKVIDDMFLKASEVLSNYAPILQDETQALFPRIKDLRGVSKEIGVEVAKIAISKGLARVSSKDAEALVDQTTWYPEYPQIKRRK